MSFSRPSNLGILACPGGEKFAQEVISHLKTIYARRFEKKVANLARAYDRPKQEVIKDQNFINDLRSSLVYSPGPTDRYRCPPFRVPCKFTRFANGEFKTEILRSIRGMDIYVVQDISNTSEVHFDGSEEGFSLSVNDNIFNLMVTLDAAFHAGARTINLVLPAYPYARQHKKKGREGLTASRIGTILEDIGVDRIITLDIHSKEIEHSFSRLSLENLHASFQILKKLNALVNIKSSDLVVVSPDTGAIDRNKFFAGSIQKPLALLYKERDYSKLSQDASSSNITHMRLLGDVKGKDVFMADDMLGTGGTLIKAMTFLREMGACRIVCAVSLPFFTGKAKEFFDEAYKEGKFYRIIGTNAVCETEELLSREWYVSANVSNLFARAISRLHHNRSLSPILDNSKIIQKMLKED